MKTFKKVAVFSLSVILLLTIAWVFIRMPIEKETREYEDISIKHDNNKYEITIKKTNEKIIVKDIEVRYTHGYISKYGSKATLEVEYIKTILGGEYHKYTLIILQSVE